MDYAKIKIKYFPRVPPKEERMEGIHPSVKGKEDGSWYASIRDKRRLEQGLKDRFVITRPTYWEACEARLEYLKDMALGSQLEAVEVTPKSPEKARAGSASLTLNATLDAYIRSGKPAPSDTLQVQVLINELGQLRTDGTELLLSEVTLEWAENWVVAMKAKRVTPNTIKKKVDCLKRAIDWAIHREVRMALKAGMPEQEVLRTKRINPLRHLEKGFQKYVRSDLNRNEDAPENTERMRRLTELEDDLIRAALRGEFYRLRKSKYPLGLSSKPLQITEKPAMYVLFVLLTNTAMRLREAYTLQRKQLNFKDEDSEIILPKTKTDTPRSFPMTMEVHDLMLDWVNENGITDPDALVFPMLWDGDRSLKALKNTSSALSTKFKRVHQYVGICTEKGNPDQLTEHDYRHEGTCRWVEMVSPETGTWAFKKEECMKYTGHKREEIFFRYMSIRGSDGTRRIWAKRPANDPQITSPAIKRVA